MPNIKRTILTFRFIQIFNTIIAVILVLLGANNLQEDGSIGIILGVILLLTVVLVEFTLRGLKKHKKWSYYTSIVITILLIPSIYIPFGIISLIELISGDNRRLYLS